MKRYLVILVVLIAVGSLPLVFSRQVFELTGTAAGQTRRRSGTVRQPATPAIDYSRFRHATKEHQETCVLCHKIPTSNWQAASGFPDVADYPGHEACVRCHRPQFFRSAKPAICSNCHSKVSPRDDQRFAFRNPAAARQFKLNFPHDKHQDVIASLNRPGKTIEKMDFVKTSWLASFQQPTQRKTYNNCEICHRDNSKLLVAPTGGWVDGLKPASEAFKSQPDSHAYCFSCHWKAQAPTNNQCGECHKPANLSVPVESPKRISMKFSHNGGGEKRLHLTECTTCHINVTKPAHLKRSGIDVPLLACKGCHSQDSGAAPPEADCRALRGARVVEEELRCLEADKNYNCAYCHTSNVGKLEPPFSHFWVANKIPFTRKVAK
jgi:hypothetical protein